MRAISRFLTAWSYSCTFAAISCVTHFDVKPPTAAPGLPPQLPDSTLSVHVDVDMGSVESAATSALPNPIAKGGDSGFLWSYSYVVNHGAVALSAIGSTIQITVPVAAHGEANAGPLGISCDPALIAQWLVVPNVGADWGVSSHTAVAGHNWTQRCKVTFLGIDITDKFDPAVGAALQAVAGKIDEAVSHIPLRTTVANLWNSLLSPIAIGDHDNNVWLAVNASTLGLSAFVGTGREETFSISAVGKPQVVFGAQPPPSSTQLPNNSGSHGGGFVIFGDLATTYAALSKAIKNAVLDQRISIGKKTIKVTDVHVVPFQAGIAIGLTLSEDAVGTLWIWGAPQIDPLTRTITITKLDFTLDTKNVLMKVGSWLLHPTILSTIERYAKLDIGVEVDKTKAALNSKLGPGIALTSTTTLSGSIDSVVPLSAYGSADGVHAIVELAGNVHVQETSMRLRTPHKAEAKEFTASASDLGQPCDLSVCFKIDAGNRAQKVTCDNTCADGLVCREIKEGSKSRHYCLLNSP